MNNLNKYIVEFLGAFVLSFVVALSLANSWAIPTAVLAGMTLMFFVYTIGHISGSHINPGVTIGLLSIGKIKADVAAVYIIVQLVAGFLAGFVAYNIMGNIPTQPVVFNMHAMIGEIVGMIIFTFGIASVVFGKVKDEVAGIVIGLSLALGISVAYLMGSLGGLNPAVMTGLHVYNLSYFLGPAIGSVIGFNLYKFLAKYAITNMNLNQNPFENAINQLYRANKIKQFDPEFINRLLKPNREVQVSIPVKMDDGSLKMFEGYRVQYNNALGPYKGGVRYHPDTEINEVRALAFWMALKCAVVNITMGGGKGGITVEPKNLSKNELEKLSRGWVKLMYPVLGPFVDVPAPDVNTNPEIMAWFVDEYSKITGDTTRASFTGKPVASGGSEGRGQATGMGGFYSFDVMRKKINLPDSCKIVIQGFGNVGGNAAQILESSGHSIIAISDSRGAIYKQDGINIEELNEYKKVNKNIKDFPGSENISNEELLLLECDVLIPAALENQITEKNASNIKTKLIVELANGSTTPEADDILFARGIPVVPDILANAGGVTVSTFEWEQNLKNEHWTEEIVFQKLKEIIDRETENIFARSKELNTDMRRAAFVIALERISEKTV